MAAPAATERCMHEALLGAASGSGTDTDVGAEPGEMEAGLQMDEAVGVLREDAAATGFPPRPAAAAAAGLAEALDAELEEEAELETAGGVNWPLLSEPELSRTGDDFFLTGRLFVPFPLCCCWRHLARRFLNQTYSEQGEGEGIRGLASGATPPPLGLTPRPGSPEPLSPSHYPSQSRALPDPVPSPARARSPAPSPILLRKPPSQPPLLEGCAPPQAQRNSARGRNVCVCPARSSAISKLLRLAASPQPRFSLEALFSLNIAQETAERYRTSKCRSATKPGPRGVSPSRLLETGVGQGKYLGGNRSKARGWTEAALQYWGFSRRKR